MEIALAGAILLPMTRALILVLIAVPVLAAGAAHAQTYPLPAGPSAYDQHRWQADQHRDQMNRLRLQADQREAMVRQLELESRLNRMELDARRSADPYIPVAPRALRSPADERALRESATERRRATEAGVGEIDAWLDRRPN